MLLKIQVLMAIRVIRSYKTITDEETPNLAKVIPFKLGRSANAEPVSKIQAHLHLAKPSRIAIDTRGDFAQSSYNTQLISKHMCRPFVEAILDS